jgi:tetratricopeptide (TPR) repeat protein
MLKGRTNHDVTPSEAVVQGYDRHRKVSFSRSHAPELSICLFLICVTLVAFWQVQFNEFIYLDDNLYVTENPFVQGGVTLKGTVWAFTEFYGGQWHPVTWLSHMLAYDLYGLNPSGHHLLNLLFHIANTLLLFLLFQRMTGKRWQSGFMAALFALHPLHVESVAWVAERKDVLFTFFWMLALWAYIRYAEKPTLGRYGLIIVCFALSLMSKSMAVTLPFVLFLLDYWPLGRLKTQKILPLIIEKVPLLFLSAGACLMTLLAAWKGGAITAFDKLSLGVRTANASISYVAYITKMFWPAPLAVLYPHPLHLPFWKGVGPFLLLALITVLLALGRRKYPYGVVGWLWYLGTLVPVIGLIQAGVQATADRFTYIPLIGLFIIIAYGLPDILLGWRFRKTTLTLSGGLALSLLMIMTISQVKVWQNTIKLFSHTLKVTDRNYTIHNNLGVLFAHQRNDQEALLHYQKALEIYPRYADAHYNLGALLARQGKDQEAMAHFYEALRIQPNKAEAQNYLGIILVQQGKIEEAISCFGSALHANPNYALAYSNMGAALLHQGRNQEAVSYLNEALRITPRDAKVHNNLGLALVYLKRGDEAEFHFTQALRNNPNYADAHCNLASLLSSQGRDQEAMTHYDEVLRINPQHAQGHYGLGKMLLREGKNLEAVAHLSEAVRIRANFEEARFSLGIAYLGMGKKDMALAEYRILKKTNTPLANTLYQNILKNTR